MMRDPAEESEQREIDLLAEQAYGLRFINAPAALDLARAVLPRAERAGYLPGTARALVAAGAARGWLSDLEAASADLERALGIFETRADPVWEARALFWQAMIARRRADYATGMQLSTEALALFWSAGDRHGEADALRMMGTLHSLIGDFVSALERFGESRQIMEELGDQHGIALSNGDTAVTLFEMGEYESSRQSQEEALACFRSMGAVSSELPTLTNLGITYSVLGDHARGLEYLNECVARCRETGERLPEARAFYNLGRVSRTMGETQKALAHFAASEELSRALGERRKEISAMIGAARTLLLGGEVDPALEKLASALSAAESSGAQRLIAEAHEALAEAHEAAGNLAAAVRHLRAFQAEREKVQRAGAELRMRHRAAMDELKQRQQETELRVLKAQLQPHFLFNVLNSIAGLIERDPATAARVVVQLGDLLRLALVQSSEQRTTLAAEIEFVSAYLQLEQVRYRDHFTYRIEVEPGLESVAVPHLLLQPLAENAIRHGLARVTGPARLEITAQRAGADRLVLRVRDNGVGLPEGWSLNAASREAPGRASGFGLRNTRLRLQRLYGSGHEFRVLPNPGGGTLVEIGLPITQGEVS